MSRERADDIDILCRLVPPGGREVVDVGCGQGALVRRLADLGARPIGVEVSDAQLEGARRADPEGRGRYVVGRAEALPLADRAVDLVVFMRALHHVPVGAMAAALAEARRVLRPDGALYVAEPLPEGDYFALTSLVEDELAVRAAAQAALGRAGEAGLERLRTLEYEAEIRLGGLEELRRRIVSVDPRRSEAFEARREDLAEALARAGIPAGDGHGRLLTAPMRADVLRPATRGR